MITDIQDTISSAQALTATASSTDVYDSGSAYDWSLAAAMCVMFTVDVAADSAAGNETYSFSVETDDDSAFSSAVTLGTKAVDPSLLAAGDKVVVPFVGGAKRYVRAKYTLGGTTPTVTVTAEVKPLLDVESHVTNLPSGYTVTI